MRKPATSFGNGTRFFKYEDGDHWQVAINISHYTWLHKSSLNRLKTAYKWLGQVIKYLEKKEG